MMHAFLRLLITLLVPVATDALTYVVPAGTYILGTDGPPGYGWFLSTYGLGYDVVDFSQVDGDITVHNYAFSGSNIASIIWPPLQYSITLNIGAFAHAQLAGELTIPTNIIFVESLNIYGLPDGFHFGVLSNEEIDNYNPSFGGVLTYDANPITSVVTDISLSLLAFARTTTITSVRYTTAGEQVGPYVFRMNTNLQEVIIDVSGVTFAENYFKDSNWEVAATSPTAFSEGPGVYTLDGNGQIVHSPLPEAGSSGDPHLHLAYGGSADFRGEPGKYYTFLSTPELTVNVRVEEADFVLRGVLVHGTFITEVHAVTDMGAAASFWAKEVGPQMFGWRMVNTTCDGQRWNHLYIHHNRTCVAAGDSTTRPFAPSLLDHVDGTELIAGTSSGDAEDRTETDALADVYTGSATRDVKFHVDYSSLHINTSNWHIRVTAKPVFDRIRGPMHRLDIAMQPSTRLVAQMSTACVHGIIGQSFQTPKRRVGKQDAYPTSGGVNTRDLVRKLLHDSTLKSVSEPLHYKEFTTSAMAEGAIEGVAGDYVVPNALATRFRYACVGTRSV